MDTRWKNRSILAAWILLLTCGLNGILNAVTDADTYLKKDYFHTPEFEMQLDEFIDYLSLFELHYIPIAEAKKRIAVTADEIAEYRYRNGDVSDRIRDMKDEYDARIEAALASDNQEVADFYTAERDRKIEDITNDFTSDDYVKAKLVKEKERRIDAYYQEMEELRSIFAKAQETFVYRLRDTETGRVFTNVASEGGTDAALDRETTVFVKRYETLSTEGRPYHVYLSETNLLLTGEGEFEGQIGVSKTAPVSGRIMANYYSFQSERIAFLIFTVIGVLAFIGAIRLTRTYPIPELASVGKLQPYYDRIPLDVRGIVFAFSAIAALALLFSADDPLSNPTPYAVVSGSANHLLLSAVFVSLVLLQGRMLWGRIGDKSAWRRSLLHRAARGLKAAFMNRSVAAQVLLLLSVVYFLGAGLLAVAAEEEAILAYIPLFFIFGGPILWFIARRAGYFNEIVRHASQLAKGNLEPDLPVKGRSALAALAGHINALKHGVKTSQTEQAKSERLKTELITNVSHDLRTPLTSIVTYTELLKQEDLSDEDRRAYVEIIDRKSQRLKTLIDDLFEATKMASGHIRLAKERIDLVQLLQQALAEFNETMKASTLQFRVATPDTPVVALVDGQKLWRVFDNLIGNCLKYALEHTRVYLSVKTIDDEAVIVFKNVAKYELNENVDELFERFKRGDASRHTEGSGLGLAIAKSIIELHEGRLEIEIDGDLFKVTVALKAC